MIYLHTKRLLTALSLIMAGFGGMQATGTGTLDQREADKMATTLRNASTPDDSIKILYDVYDLSDRSKRKEVGLQILEIAQRTHNEQVLIDLLSRLSNKVDDVEAIRRLMNVTSGLPADSASRGVELVLEMEEAKKEAESTNPQQVHDQVVKLGRIDLLDKEDLYEEIIDLYRAMVTLGVQSQGSLYLEYIIRLGELVHLLPEDDFAIRNLYYTTAALYFTRRGFYEKALEADRELLKQIDLLEKKNKRDRRFLDLSYVRYISYQRMLDNYQGLTPEEVEDLYQRCVKLAEENEEVANIFGVRGITKSSYYMARGDYANAIPELHKALSDSTISNNRKMRLLGRLATALRNTGDTKEELEVLRQYNDMLSNDKMQRTEDAYQELQIRREIDKLAINDQKEQQQLREENREMRKISLTLVYVLAVILIFMVSAYFRLKKKTKNLEDRNRKLHANMEYIFDDGTPRGTSDLRKPSRERLKG